MNWRDTLIGAVVSLLVAILSGVAIFYFTRQPPTTAPFEKLVYSLETSGTFGDSSGGLTFLSMNVSNLGSKAAHNVHIVSEVSASWKLQDHQVRQSVGSAATLTDHSSDNKLDITIPILVPEESATISMLVRGPGKPNPQISILSSEASATKLEPVSALEKEKSFPRLGVFGLVLVALGLQFVGVAFLRRVAPHIFKGAFRATTFSRNNTAFVLLLQGRVEDAKTILQRQIWDDGGEPIVLANYGLALGLQGDAGAAATFFDAANWWGKSKHEKAVINFNRATLSISQGDLVSARKCLSEAINLGKQEIQNYCQLSTYIQAAAKGDSEIAELLKVTK